jgi:hypothetical protein
LKSTFPIFGVYIEGGRGGGGVYRCGIKGMTKPPVERTPTVVEVRAMLAYFRAVAEGLIWDLELEF